MSSNNDDIHTKSDGKVQLKGALKSIFDSSIIDTQFFRRILLPWIVLCTVLIFVLITNGHHADNVEMDILRQKRQIDELRIKKIQLQSDLIRKSRRDTVLKLLERKGSTLHEATTPPQKITGHNSYDDE